MGEDEVCLVVVGVKCGIVNVIGLVVDLGGGSFEFFIFKKGIFKKMYILGIGVFILKDVLGGDLKVVEEIVWWECKSVDWFDWIFDDWIYVVGGVWCIIVWMYMKCCNYEFYVLY